MGFIQLFLPIKSRERRDLYNLYHEAYNFLGKKVREMNLKPTGYPRTLGLVAPYTGREIKPDKYVIRLA